MSNRLIISEKIAHTLIQVCQDVREFLRLSELHAEPVKINLGLALFSEESSGGIIEFLNTENKTEFINKTQLIIKQVEMLRKHYKELIGDPGHKDKIQAQLYELKYHLQELIMEVQAI